jgi:hypothetical protein
MHSSPDGIPIDDDGTIYIPYGKWVPNGADAKLWIAKLDDNLQEEGSQLVFHPMMRLDNRRLPVL